jgi:hypothetical protein
MPLFPIPPRSLVLALLFSVLPGCASPSLDGTTDEQTAPDVPVRSEDDELVEARLGPHRFAFARSYLRFGMAPGNDTTIELVMTMPDLAPMKREPPSGSLEGAEKVEVWVRALDEAAMGRVFSDWMRLEHSDPKPDPLSDDKPRIKGDAVSGLMPFYLDLAALRRQAEARGEKPDTVASPHRVYNRDWYLAYDADGTMVSFIECTPKILDDGLALFDGHLHRGDAGNTDVVAECDHKFLIADLNASVRIEDSVRRTIEGARIR